MPFALPSSFASTSQILAVSGRSSFFLLGFTRLIFLYRMDRFAVLLTDCFLLSPITCMNAVNGFSCYLIVQQCAFGGFSVHAAAYHQLQI